MTIKRVILGILTIVAIAFTSLSLLGSLTQPQIQSRLELYQTNLVLEAVEWKLEETENANLIQGRNALLGQNVFQMALEQYQDLRDSAETNLKKIIDKANPTQADLEESLDNRIYDENIVSNSPYSDLINKLKKTREELNLRIGLLQVRTEKKEEAIQTWNNLINTANQINDSPATAETARVLIAMWSDEIGSNLVDAEPLIQRNLDGWFRDNSLAKLYEIQGYEEELSKLKAAEQEKAETAFYKLAIVSALPGIGLLMGVGLLIFIGVQRLVAGKNSLLLKNAEKNWEIPWGGETILQVFVVGFFAVGQIILPLGLEIFKKVTDIQPASMGVRVQAGYILATYLLLAFGGILVLYLSIKEFMPLPEGWFKIKWRSDWFWWGLGGYFVALPLVILISLINQQIWQGQGGSNPILPIALQGQDSIALILFFVTASIAAPIFEEIMFRGFLLPSLTKYLPMWGAILASSLLFAVAHLNISEVLPLAVLGVILAVVYTRSRNLLSSMLLHALWNGGTLLSLFILGSGIQ